MRWDTVLFDMDGTLTDSQEGIVKSVSYALERLGRELPPRDTLTAFIGPPLHESFSAICGMDEAETERAVCEFRDYFARRGWAENVPYEGMAEFLAALHAAGLRLIVATSKPESFARKILEHFALERYFDLICGSHPETFLDFAPYLDGCRFVGCSHTKEKGCAVLEAVRAGKLSASRHASYLRLYNELKDLREWSSK